MTDAALAKRGLDWQMWAALNKTYSTDKVAFDGGWDSCAAFAAEQTAALRAALSESVRIFEEAYGDDSDAALVPSAREAEWYRKSRSLLADHEGQRAGEELRALIEFYDGVQELRARTNVAWRSELFRLSSAVERARQA